MVGSEISWWFRNILPLGSGLIGMVPKYPAARARINRNGSDSSGSEISCDTASHAPFQLSFWALSSASVSRLQLLQGRPLLRFPWGFQLRACRVMLAGGFLSVWPIQPHFLWRIYWDSGSCPARSHKSVLLILSGHRMPRIRRRQVLTKHWIFWCNALVVRNVSHPYSNTDLTLELKILSLVPVIISVDPQIFFNRTKAPLALPTLALTSWSVPPFLSTTLPRYTKLSTSFTYEAEVQK